MKLPKTLIKMALRDQYIYLLDKCKDTNSVYHDQNTRYSFFLTKQGLYSFRGSVDFYSVYESNWLSIEELRKLECTLTTSTLLDTFDYVSVHTHDFEKRKITSNITHISVKSSEYWDKPNGGMYFSSLINVWTLDGEQHILKVPFAYGHGSNIEHKCFNRIKEVFTSVDTDSDNFTHYCREHGIKLGVQLIEGCKYKDLYHG